MKKEEFIKWLEEKSGFSRNSSDDNSWKEEMNYADYIYDYLDIENDYVEFTWEEMYWGGSNINTNKYEFEEFIEKYESESLKY